MLIRQIHAPEYGSLFQYRATDTSPRVDQCNHSYIMFGNQRLIVPDAAVTFEYEDMRRYRVLGGQVRLEQTLQGLRFVSGSGSDTATIVIVTGLSRGEKKSVTVEPGTCQVLASLTDASTGTTSLMVQLEMGDSFRIVTTRRSRWQRFKDGEGSEHSSVTVTTEKPGRLRRFATWEEMTGSNCLQLQSAAVQDGHQDAQRAILAASSQQVAVTMLQQLGFALQTLQLTGESLKAFEIRLDAAGRKCTESQWPQNLAQALHTVRRSVAVISFALEELNENQAPSQCIAGQVESLIADLISTINEAIKETGQEEMVVPDRLSIAS